MFAVDVPITKGYTCILHHGSVQVAASVKKLVGLLDKATGEVAQNTKKPRLLTKGNNAVVEIATETPVCLDLYANSKELGRFMLRTGGKTIAAGMVADTWWCNQMDYILFYAIFSTVFFWGKNKKSVVWQEKKISSISFIIN